MADTSIKLSGTYDSIEAYQILEEMRDMSEDYEDIKTEAEAAASAATAAVATANAAVTNATTAANNASTYAGNANASASDAAGYAANASTSATNAATSETNASNSAGAAATSESNASASATNAAASAAAAALAITPTGSVIAFAGSTSPAGWLLCDGSAVSRTDYAALYAVIGTTYGAGNGSTTFNLPNLTDKFIQGNATSGTERSAGLPNITGVITNTIWNADGYEQYTGAFSVNENLAQSYGTAGALSSRGFNFDASRSSAIYGNSNTVQPPSVTMRYIIKY
jgi:hypothetical protein